MSLFFGLRDHSFRLFDRIFFVAFEWFVNPLLGFLPLRSSDQRFLVSSECVFPKKGFLSPNLPEFAIPIFLFVSSVIAGCKPPWLYCSPPLCHQI